MFLQKYYKPNLFTLIIIVLHVYTTNATQPRENNDLYKIKLEPSRYFFETLKQNQNLAPRTTHKNRTTVNNSATEASHIKKWQVGRVSRRQYEIINMLWRKTKEFIDVEMSTASYRPEYPLYKLPSRLLPTPTTITPSFIEFYYLDENDDRIKSSNQKYQLHKDSRPQHLKRMNPFNNDYPVFAFHINNRNNELFVSKHLDANTKTLLKVETASPPLIGLLNSVTFQKINKSGPNKRTAANPISISPRVNYMNKIQDFVTEPLYVVENETCPVTTQNLITRNKETVTKSLISNPSIPTNNNLLQSTIAYDKIKFFEMYDKQTPLPYYKDEGKPVDLEDIEKVINGNILNNDQKILLEHVDQSFGKEHSRRDKPSHAKKHIIENNKSYSKELITENILIKPTHSLNISVEKKNYTKDLTLNVSLSSKSKVPTMPENIINKVAAWPDYSFMAVYIYEPAQVHCDAAGISPHWLVTSGSCLARHHKNPGGEGRSAFVAYCGISWWAAERIAYVKYSVVHPHYSPRDNNRRYMYNIGLIQVVISLTTCPGWVPIPLMSHRYVADPEGTRAYAIGWGLDRYNTRYTSADLPKHPLMAYESRVFSDSCPGSMSYVHLKNKAEDDVSQNLYCLSLPPYLGEDTDPIHGSMLVVGGKLCAIYLQEERRPSGDQSAEYTGTWRLEPWVTHVAREPDDGEPFTFVI